MNAYPITDPNPAEAGDADRCAEPQVLALFAALAGRAMDGGALYEHLIADPANHAYDGVAGIAAGDQPAIDERAARFLAWFERADPAAHRGRRGRLEPDAARVRVRCLGAASRAAAKRSTRPTTTAKVGSTGTASTSTPRRTLGAVPGSETTGLPARTPRTTIPVPVSFAGMPNTRWWAFEDAKTNYGDIDANTTDLAKLLFLEFALVYANDWFVIPYTAPGRHDRDRRRRGGHQHLRRALLDRSRRRREPTRHWQRWSMFTIDVHNDSRRRGRHQPAAAADAWPKSSTRRPTRGSPADPRRGRQHGLGRRDDSADGQRRKRARSPGRRQTSRLLPGPAARGAADLRRGHAARSATDVMSSVPENWIPFLPVHVEGSNREIQLQRAAMPRILEGDPNPPQKVQPRTVLLRQGLDLTPAQTIFRPRRRGATRRRGGTASASSARAGATDASTCGCGCGGKTGRGEGSSGLGFDELVNVT